MPLKPKKIPMRMCVACREMRPKAELLRVVKPQDGEAHIDFKGKAPGRGAYICPDPACLAKAQKSKGLERSFKTAVPKEVYEELMQALEAGEDA